MTDFTTAWIEFSNALAVAQELHAEGAGPEVLRRYYSVRELLRAVDDELAANEQLPADARSALEQLRAELVELESVPVTRH